jgi:hypothetical protein
VAGESLRQLADDYAVSHTSLCRYFARPEVDKQLRALARKGAGRRTNDQVAPTKLYTRETPDRPERVSGRQ